jgi:hypothetical protein
MLLIKHSSIVLSVLAPFECEDCTLTYFRAPDIKTDVTEDDELFCK